MSEQKFSFPNIVNFLTVAVALCAMAVVFVSGEIDGANCDSEGIWSTVLQRSQTNATMPSATVPNWPAPNVLFYIDSGAVTMFAPWGRVPTVNDAFTAQTGETNPNDYKVVQYKATNLQNFTFGSGMRNVMFGTGSEDLTQERWSSPAGGQVASVDGGYRLVEAGARNPTHNSSNTGGGFSRMGRDLDASNNIIGDPTCYYSVFPDKPYFLTFKNRLLAWHDWKNGPPNLATLPIGAIANEHLAAQNSYNAIKEYMPGGTLAGQPVPLALANIHLVPNDSRIYKLKPALWNFIAEGNGEKLSKINVGISEIYKSYMNNSWQSYIYHGHGVSPDMVPYTMAVSGDWRYYGAWMNQSYGNPSGDVNSPYGSGASFIFGINSVVVDTTQQQGMGQMIKIDISNWGGDTNPDTDTNNRSRSWSRALLTLPFDKLYQMSGGLPEATQHFGKLTELIDGIERYETDMNQNVSIFGKPAIPNNQEIFAAGTNFSATALYGGRITTPDANLGKTVSGWTTGARGVYHQNMTSGLPNLNALIQYAQDNAVVYPDGTIFLEKMANSEGLNTGQAAGSAIDFFSPLSGANFTNGLQFDDDTKGFFPVTSARQKNWVVLLISDSEGLKGFPQNYTIAKAALKLFQNTLTMRGREWKNGAWQEKTDYSMSSGVRTIVVGIVDDSNPNTMAVMADVVRDINETAKYGDPVLKPGGNPMNPSDWIPNQNAKAYIVKDAKGITAALDEILQRVLTNNISDSPQLSTTILNLSPGDEAEITADSEGTWTAEAPDIIEITQSNPYYMRVRALKLGNTKIIFTRGADEKIAEASVYVQLPAIKIMNEELKYSGVELNMLSPDLFASAGAHVETAVPVMLCYAESGKPAGVISVNISGYADTSNVLLPMQYTLRLTDSELKALCSKVGRTIDISNFFSQDGPLNGEAVREFFNVFVIQKEILQGTRKGQLARLLGAGREEILTPQRAIADGSLTMTANTADRTVQIEFRYLVRDGDYSPSYNEAQKKIIIGDGLADRMIVDPLWVSMRKLTDRERGVKIDGGSGCSVTPSAAVSTPLWWLLMGVIPLVVRRKR